MRILTKIIFLYYFLFRSHDTLFTLLNALAFKYKYRLSMCTLRNEIHNY